MSKRKITTASRKPKPDKRIEEYGEGLHTFASNAYSAALTYYSKHHNDPVALAAFSRQLEDDEWPEFINVDG